MNKGIYGDTTTGWYWKPKNLRTKADREKMRSIQEAHAKRLAENGIKFVANNDGTMSSINDNQQS